MCCSYKARVLEGAICSQVKPFTLPAAPTWRAAIGHHIKQMHEKVGDKCKVQEVLYGMTGFIHLFGRFSVLAFTFAFYPSV